MDHKSNVSIWNFQLSNYNSQILWLFYHENQRYLFIKKIKE